METEKEIEKEIEKETQAEDLSALFKDISEVLKAQGEEIASLKKQLEGFKTPESAVTSDDFKTFKQEMADILQSYNRTVNTGNTSSDLDFDKAQMNLLNRRF